MGYMGIFLQYTQSHILSTWKGEGHERGVIYGSGKENVTCNRIPGLRFRGIWAVGKGERK